MRNFVSVIVPIIIASAAVSGALAQNTKAEENMSAHSTSPQQQNHPYVGMWVTDDGRIRHELLPNGRYDEARGSRQSAYQGRYVVTGNHIDYWDDTGFTADGVFVDENTLHHAGMILRRQ
ncbi:protein Atu4866 [Rhizobium sp. RU33A]|uniref:Atu4866 domain-containing protein n=1 Tax=Rhizobium sp. RU33A TaxID=1907413 RepID=UPI000954056F|nr:Atu4866 domain-containing protein [Rhizobium sp. RU33A]SIQ36805.1 protein Atu4866 [Rhizobium sp. RU33A]